MSRRASARVAGFAFLVYIVVAMTGMALSRQAGGEQDPSAKLATIAAHAGALRVAVLLDVLSCACALVLAVTLYVITRDEDPNLSLMVLVFRTAEGVIGAVSLQRSFGRIWLATASGPTAPDPASASALAAVLLKTPSWSFHLAGWFFSVGSLVFAYLLLRGRIVPTVLAWIGVVGSILTVVGLPLQMAELIHSPVTDVMWIPLLLFEVPLGFWLIVKGAAMPQRRQPA